MLIARVGNISQIRYVILCSKSPLKTTNGTAEVDDSPVKQRRSVKRILDSDSEEEGGASPPASQSTQKVLSQVLDYTMLPFCIMCCY